MEPQPAFATGAAVALANLQSRPELNGTGGTVLAWDEGKGRYAVAAKCGERLMLKPACLLPAAAATTSIDGIEFTLRNDAEFPAALLDELRRRGLTPSDRYHCGLDDAPGTPAPVASPITKGLLAFGPSLTTRTHTKGCRSL